MPAGDTTDGFCDDKSSGSTNRRNPSAQPYPSINGQIISPQYDEAKYVGSAGYVKKFL